MKNTNIAKGLLVITFIALFVSIQHAHKFKLHKNPNWHGTTTFVPLDSAIVINKGEIIGAVKEIKVNTSKGYCVREIILNKGYLFYPTSVSLNMPMKKVFSQRGVAVAFKQGEGVRGLYIQAASKTKIKKETTLNSSLSIELPYNVNFNTELLQKYPILRLESVTNDYKGNIRAYFHSKEKPVKRFFNEKQKIELCSLPNIKSNIIHIEFDKKSGLYTVWMFQSPVIKEALNRISKELPRKIKLN